MVNHKMPADTDRYDPAVGGLPGPTATGLEIRLNLKKYPRRPMMTGSRRTGCRALLASLRGGKNSVRKVGGFLADHDGGGCRVA